MKNIIIAIDGPAGSGKTTTARETAKKLGYVYIDTGAMYRAVTLGWLREKRDFDEKELCAMLDKTEVKIELINGMQRTFLNGEDVSEPIRFPEVTKMVSPVSAVACVREKLVEMQRQLGKNGGVVLDGRDIGTVVFPQAELKIFLIASPAARAKRRKIELDQSGISLPEEEILKQITDRDRFDSSRANSPLRKADDAIIIDTSEITIEEQTALVYNMALKKIRE